MESYASGFGRGTGLVFSTTKPCSNPSSQKPLISLWKLKKPYSFLYSHCYSTTTRCSSNNRRDPNAETRRFNFKFKFRDKNNIKNDDSVRVEEDEKGGSTREGKRRKRRWWSDQEEEPPGILEEAIDSLWVLQLAKSYGWMFPPIVITSLLVSGPKAFLSVLALSVGQSALTFAFQKLLGKTSRKPKRKARKRRKTTGSPLNDADFGDEKQEKEEAVKGRMGYRSWGVGDNGSFNEDNQDAPNFGGWDEFDTTGSVQRRPQRKRQPRKKPLANGKWSGSGRKSDMPLLLRLLIAVFPFLGSWTKML
ncbi:hypothetical protein OIU77_014612 [Salix suchowensis]|uniref:Transmembrane protein n=1 Tax=Salix suchowensis TaxID=1278906 RepID=A0ABQ8ZXT1_9ROSI|nr:hypothetical protein OIU77_014612 [Salix suchowensis]